MLFRLTSIAALLLTGLAATAAPIQIKIATLAPENSSWMREMRAGAAEVAAVVATATAVDTPNRF